ncbi:MAG: hypothetical protein WC775_02465 [Patescibacteria group bacterium]|jgi:TM2 domain-containing membrane protein YozV
MALTEAQKRRIEEEERYREQMSNQIVATQTQKHGFPALLSLFIPGLGQLVKSQVGKGLLIFICTIIGYMMFFLPGFLIHLWQIADAYNN